MDAGPLVTLGVFVLGLLVGLWKHSLNDAAIAARHSQELQDLKARVTKLDGINGH